MVKPAVHAVVRSGFTLVEVLVVVVIIGILSVVGISGMRGMLAQEAVKGQALALRAFFDEVSARARTQDDTVTVKVVGDSLQAFASANCTGTRLSSFVLDNKAILVSAAAAALPAELNGLPNLVAVCMPFDPVNRIGRNPMDTSGYLVLRSRQDTDVWGMVGKAPAYNKPLSFLSLDGGHVWRRL